MWLKKEHKDHSGITMLQLDLTISAIFAVLLIGWRGPLWIIASAPAGTDTAILNMVSTGCGALLAIIGLYVGLALSYRSSTAGGSSGLDSKKFRHFSWQGETGAGVATEGSEDATSAVAVAASLQAQGIKNYRISRDGLVRYRSDQAALTLKT